MNIERGTADGKREKSMGGMEVGEKYTVDMEDWKGQEKRKKWAYKKVKIPNRTTKTPYIP